MGLKGGFCLGIDVDKQKGTTILVMLFWLREPDLNRRPSDYEPDELPDCSIPRHHYSDFLKKVNNSTHIPIIDPCLLGKNWLYLSCLYGWVAQLVRAWDS